MLIVANQERYQRYCALRKTPDRYRWHALWLPMILFGSLGAITWAIRGTSGWGGIDGTLLPGLTWGLLWYYLCWRKGVDARGVVLWLGLSIALGGELGYGQYVSWIRGQFRHGDAIIPIAPAVGYVWFLICGIGWAAPGGIILGWALHSRVTPRYWLVRTCLVLVLLVFIFNLPIPLLGMGAISWLGEQFVHYCPNLLFPHAAMGLYAGELDSHLGRTVYTNTQNFAVLLWWLGALAVAAFQRDRATLVSGVIIGGGFGIGFALSAVWCLGYSHAPGWIDWWKMWELHAGFNLGPMYVLVLYWALGRVHKPPVSATPSTDTPAETGRTLFLAVAGFLFIFAAGVEYFFWTGLFLATFFAGALIATTSLGRHRASELRKRVSLSYTVFLLLFMLCHGGVSRTGVFLELYSAEATDQYAWPPGRVILFAPVAILLVTVMLIVLRRHCRAPRESEASPRRLPERMVDLFAFIALVGAVSIWPSKIGVLYALLLMVALFAFTRLNRYFDARLDNTDPPQTMPTGAVPKQ